MIKIYSTKQFLTKPVVVNHRESGDINSVYKITELCIHPKDTYFIFQLSLIKNSIKKIGHVYYTGQFEVLHSLHNVVGNYCSIRYCVLM